jgi:hypothetical protein
MNLFPFRNFIPEVHGLRNLAGAQFIENTQKRLPQLTLGLHLMPQMLPARCFRKQNAKTVVVLITILV